MSKRGRALSVLLIAISQIGPAAELTVSKLEIATIGSFQGDAFQLASIATAEASIQGGYKFGGALRFAFTSGDVEKALQYANTPAERLGDADVLDKDAYNLMVDRLKNLTGLSFELARVSVRQPFQWPVELDYFIGTTTTFCSGNEFAQRFGIISPETAFRGYSYYPQGINGNPAVQFDGIHAVTGTGFALAINGSENFVPIVYLYQDAALPSGSGYDIDRGRYSADFRLLVNDSRFKAELFAGATLPYGRFGMYRGGLLFFVPVGNGTEFMGQAGITRWNPGESFGLDNLYFLMEPRIDLGFTSIILTLFYHPRYYLQKDTGESGAIDLNFKVLLGDLKETGTEGGVETTVGIRKPTATNNSFRVRISPFFGLVTEGVRWDIKLMINPMSIAEPLKLVETFLGVRTAY